MLQQDKVYSKIFIFSRDESSIKRLNGYMSDLGFSFKHFAETEELMLAYKKEGADLIMVDLDSATDQGFDLMANFSQRYPDTPIICLVLNAKDQALQSLRLGAWDCIEKSHKQFPQIEQAVCKALERSRVMHENKLYRYQLEEINNQLERSLKELEFDHKAGKSVQEQIFPEPCLHVGEYDFSYRILPSLYLSGDMVGYFQIDNEHIGFYIADVSGHGASSAFVTIMLKVLLDQMLQDFLHQKKPTILEPKSVLTVANQYVKAANLGKYITMVYCVLDVTTHKLTYSVAGHYPNPIVLIGQDATVLPGKGFAVGMLEKATFQEQTIDFPKNALLTLFSDGLMEEIQGASLDDKEATLLDCLHAKISLDEMLKILKLDSLRDHPDDVTLLFVGRAL